MLLLCLLHKLLRRFFEVFSLFPPPKPPSTAAVFLCRVRPCVMSDPFRPKLRMPNTKHFVPRCSLDYGLVRREHATSDLGAPACLRMCTYGIDVLLKRTYMPLQRGMQQSILAEGGRAPINTTELRYTRIIARSTSIQGVAYYYAGAWYGYMQPTRRLVHAALLRTSTWQYCCYCCR